MREQGGARGIGPHNEVSDALTCSIASTLKVIGDKWTLLILRDAFRGVRRFDDFACDLGIARNLLTDRLAKLVEHGILARVPYQERPLRHEYRLTASGIDLSPALVAFIGATSTLRTTSPRSCSCTMRAASRSIRSSSAGAATRPSPRAR